MNEVIQAVLIALVSAVVPSVVTGCLVYVKSQKKEDSALKSGILSLLRAEIIRQNDKYIERGYCPIYAKDALEKEYKAYHSLGGNGTITIIYNETMALPEEPEGDTK